MSFWKTHVFYLVQLALNWKRGFIRVTAIKLAETQTDVYTKFYAILTRWGGFGTLWTACPADQMLPLCGSHTCHEEKNLYFSRWEQFPILKTHFWISNVNINPEIKLKCISILLQVGCLFSPCVQNCRPIMCTRQHHTHCYSSAEVGGVGDNGWQNLTKHCDRASRTAVPEKCS